TRVVAGAVAFPRRTRHQILERLVLPVGDQVARTLPALDVVSGIAPSGARQLAPALQEFHVQRGLANRVFRGDAVEVAELFAYVVARQENLAVVDGGVSIGGRDLVPVHVELPQVFEQLLDLPHIGLFVDRGVGADLEAGLLGDLDTLDGQIENAFALDGQVVILPHAIQVDVEVEALIRREFADPLLDEHAVGAKVNMAVALQDARCQLADLRIHHGFAAADGNHRRAALIHRGQALLERHPLGDGGFVLAYAPAAGAGEVAGVQRLQHQDDGEALADHGMRLPFLTGLRRQKAERVGRAGIADGVLLPLRPGPQLVPENVAGQAGGHREWKFHNLSFELARVFTNEDSASSGK